jgi:hypothetical protein
MIGMTGGAVDAPSTSVMVVRSMMTEDCSLATSLVGAVLDGEEYIRSLARGPAAWVTHETANLAIGLLGHLRSRVHGIQVPTIAPTEDGSIGFTWRNSVHYVHMELRADREVETFYENLHTGEMWSDEDNEITDDVVKHLRLLF